MEDFIQQITVNEINAMAKLTLVIGEAGIGKSRFCKQLKLKAKNFDEIFYQNLTQDLVTNDQNLKNKKILWIFDNYAQCPASKKKAIEQFIRENSANKQWSFIIASRPYDYPLVAYNRSFIVEVLITMLLKLLLLNFYMMKKINKKLKI